MRLVFSTKIARLLVVLTFLLLALLNAKVIRLESADLGRHLANGRAILESGLSHAVLRTNLYSYTEPSFPFVNHHWMSGVVFEGIRRLGGFTALSLFQLSLVLGTVKWDLDLDNAESRAQYITRFERKRLAPRILAGKLRLEKLSAADSASWSGEFTQESAEPDIASTT